MEKLIEKLPNYIHTCVKERKPKKSKEAVEYANDYLESLEEHMDPVNLDKR